jgi:hypothetical protein
MTEAIKRVSFVYKHQIVFHLGQKKTIGKK